MTDNRNHRQRVPFIVLLFVGSLLLALFAQPRPAATQQPLPSAGHGSAFEALRTIVAARAARGLSRPDADYGYLAKLDSTMQRLVIDALSGRDVIQSGRAQMAGMRYDGSVLSDIYVSGDLDAAEATISAVGMQVGATDNLFHRVTGYLPVGQALAVAQLAQVKAVITVNGYGTNTGSALSEGDAAHSGPAARALGYNGSGVKVGVISDSINRAGTGLSGSQLAGDLPAATTVITDGLVGSSDEGRAMAEIIYDTAPGISRFYFATGVGSGASGKASAINSLVNAGVQIIADDTYYLGEAFFQDGVVAQAVDAARAKGVLYFASAGNRARQSYEHTFITSTNAYHNFNPGGTLDQVQRVVTVPNGRSIQIVLQWDDPWGNAQNDFDIWLVNDAQITQILDSGTSDNKQSGIPLEIVTWQNNTGSSVAVAVYIQQYAGPATNSFLKYIARGDFGTFTIAQYNTNSDTIDPDAASASGALTVAATYWNQAGLNAPESYSSRGLKTRFFDANGNRYASPHVLQKPLIAGADCVSTSATFDSGLQFGGAGGFCGTSAAAPSVAGIAALMKSANPLLAAPFLENLVELSLFN